MMIRSVFRLPYREAHGRTVGLLWLMGLNHLKVFSLTQVNIRFRYFDITPLVIPVSSLITITIYSTGIKVCGEGKWKCRKIGWIKRRTRRKLYLDVDPEVGFIHCYTSTTNSEGDESQIDDLLDQVDAETDGVYLDGFYDAQTCHDGLLGRGIWPSIPLQRGAVKLYRKEPGDADDSPHKSVFLTHG